MSTVARSVVLPILFLLVLLSGFWTSRSGRPLNVAASTVHKLVSLGAGIFIIATLVQRNRIAPLGNTEWLVIAIAGLCFLGLVATGGFLTSDKPLPSALLRVHQILPALAILSALATFGLVLGR